MKILTCAMLLAASLLIGQQAMVFAQDAPKPLTLAEFEKLHKELVPPDSIWTTIPWETSLVAAQHLAIENGKPIYIWSMDGHPLGCT